MTNIISFKSRPELDAQENLNAFIVFAREKLISFGKNLPFDDVVWDVTDECGCKGNGNKRQRLIFCTLLSATIRKPVPLSDNFRSFAQAYMRQMQALRPVVSLTRRITSLRVLEAALVENGEKLSPVQININILNRAAQITKEHFSVSLAYHVGIHLELITEFMNMNRLTMMPFSWRNPNNRPQQGVIRVGREFDEKRSRLMPSEAVLEALPYIFQHSTKPRDVLTSATAAILCSAPSRICELLLLPNECETTGIIQEKSVYGLRWLPVKGGRPMVKWILPSMVDVVKEALRKIREITEPAREISIWYELNPGKLYLSPGLEWLRAEKMVSLAMLQTILWGNQGSELGVKLWCKRKGLQLHCINKTYFAYFSEFEKLIVEMLPFSFPLLHNRSDIKYSQALMVIQKNKLNKQKHVILCAVEHVSIQQINDALSARMHKSGLTTIFDDFGFVEPDGERIRVTTHQFRHYLNTLAQAGGLSQLDIAKWSGRKDIRQNEAYDHVSAGEMLQIIRESVGDISKVVGPLATIPKQSLIRRDEFSRLIIPTAHTSDIGYCIHDYTMSPCLVHRDCINCQEHVCVKGDSVKTARLQQNLREAEDLLSKAKAAVENEYFGSDRWLEHHMLTTERLRQLCEIMDDPKVPVGSIIQLNNVKSASRIEQAAIVRAQLAITKGNQTPMLKTFNQSISARANRKDD